MEKVLGNLSDQSALTSISPALKLVNLGFQHQGSISYDRRFAFALRTVVKAKLDDKDLPVGACIEKLAKAKKQSELIFDVMYPSGIGVNQSGERDQEALSQILSVVLEHGLGEMKDIHQLLTIFKSNSQSDIEPYLSQLYLVAQDVHPSFQKNEESEVSVLKLAVIKAILPLQQAAMKFSFWLDEVSSTNNLKALCAQTIDAVRAVSDVRGIHDLLLKQSLIYKAFHVATEAYKKMANDALKSINNEPSTEAKNAVKASIGKGYLASINQTVLLELNRLLDLTDVAVDVLFPNVEQTQPQNLMQG